MCVILVLIVVSCSNGEEVILLKEVEGTEIQECSNLKFHQYNVSVS